MTLGERRLDSWSDYNENSSRTMRFSTTLLIELRLKDDMKAFFCGKVILHAMNKDGVIEQTNLASPCLEGIPPRNINNLPL